MQILIRGNKFIQNNLSNIYHLSNRKPLTEEILNKELHNNPYFDKAFPTLAEHKDPTTIHNPQEELAYMDTLKKYYKHSKKYLSKSEIDYENYRRYIEGFQSPRGPISNMSAEEKLKINVLIDQKFTQLEETGLSRQEILTNGKTKGIPLKQDAFFQYLKKNYKAREVYLAENEDYSVQKIVNLALRQDLGSDSFGGAKDPRKTIESKPIFNIKPSKMSNSILSTTDKSTQSLMNQIIKQDKIYAPQNPKTRRDRLNENTRFINNYDIHWRNTEYLCQFLNHSGKIQSRFQTFLTTPQQKKVARAVKTARNMLLLPHSNYIYPYFKKSLTSLQEDFEDFIRKKINLTTGQIYQQTPHSRMSQTLDDMNLQMDYELQISATRPTGQALDLVKAQVYADRLKQEALQQEGIDIDLLKKQRADDGLLNKMSVMSNQPQFSVTRNEDQIKLEVELQSDPQETEECYKILKEELKQIPYEDLPEAILFEASVEYDKLRELKTKISTERVSKYESVQYINKIRSRVGLLNINI